MGALERRWPQLVEIAGGIELTMPERIYIELVNDPTLFKLKANAAGLDLPIERGCLELHESAPMPRSSTAAR